MAYLLDANVFISAKRAHYGFDFCPGFWDWLLRANAAGQVYCIEKVANELTGSGDDLSLWIQPREAQFSIAVDQSVLPSFGVVSTWVMGRATHPLPKRSFSKWQITI